MNLFQQHIPAFCDVDHPPAVAFETTEELLALEIVQRYRKRRNFSHFAMSDNVLMVISDAEYHWWPVGYIKYPEQINLPKWNGGKYRAELPNGKHVELESSRVIMSCGDTLTLNDGTKARWLR